MSVTRDFDTLDDDQDSDMAAFETPSARDDTTEGFGGTTRTTTLRERPEFSDVTQPEQPYVHWTTVRRNEGGPVKRQPTGGVSQRLDAIVTRQQGGQERRVVRRERRRKK
jgi:hypothetical protein